jgi:hypothetical protein
MPYLSAYLATGFTVEAIGGISINFGITGLHHRLSSKFVLGSVADLEMYVYFKSGSS